MPEWWLNLISPMVTDYCVLKHGSEFGCQLNLTLIIVGMPIALFVVGPLINYYRRKNK